MNKFVAVFLWYLIVELPKQVEFKSAEILLRLIEIFDPLPPSFEGETTDEYFNRIGLNKVIRYFSLRLKTHIEVNEDNFWAVTKQYNKKDRKLLIKLKQMLEYVRERDQSWLDRAIVLREMKKIIVH